MADYRFEREVRTPHSEAYLILDGEQPVARIDLHFTGPSTHGVLHVVETVTQDVVEATCVLPTSGDWMVSQSCTASGSATAPGSVIVETNVTLTIAENASLDIDFPNFHLLIRSGAKVVIKDGGKIS